MTTTPDLVAFLDSEVYPFLDRAAVFRDLDPKDKGSHYLCLCPKCGERTSYVYKGAYALRCNRRNKCGHTGSMLDHVSGGVSPRGRDWVEAARKLADLAGVKFPERQLSEEEKKRAEERDRRQSLFEAFLSIVQEDLWTDGGAPARDYLVNKRGFKEADLEELELGFYTSPDNLRPRLVAKGFTVDEVNASGLVFDSRWSGRLVGVWRDKAGRIGTFWARDLTGTSEEGEKYLRLALPPKGWGAAEDELVAAGLDEALRSKEGRDHLVLVEGFIDVVSLHRRGFVNVAALGGAGDKLSVSRWEKLAGFGVRTMTLVFDNDEAGRKGTLRAITNSGMVNNVSNVYVVDPVELSPYKDPDELVREKGLDAFRTVLQKRIPAAVYMGAAFLDGITPSSPDVVKREAVLSVASYVEKTLRGVWSKVDASEVLRIASERTGWSRDDLQPILDAAEARGKKEALERELDGALKRAATSRENKDDVFTVARDLQDSLVSIHSRTLDQPPPFSVDRIREALARTPAGKPSGWKNLDDDEKAGGIGLRFNAGELAVLVGRPAHGKTSALVGLVRNWLDVSTNDEEVFLVYSFEEPEEFLTTRLLAISTAAPDEVNGWTSKQIRDWTQDRGSRGKDYGWPPPRLLEDAWSRLRSWESRLQIIFRPGWSVTDLEVHARAIAARRKVGAVLVDYWQKITPPGGGGMSGKEDRRDIALAVVGRRLKALAVDLSCPVVVGAQAGRDTATSGSIPAGKPFNDEAVQKILRGRRFTMEQIREGGIEQEVDLALGLLNYRADYREGPEFDSTVPDETPFEVGVLKNRYGAPGRWVALDYVGKFQYIRDSIPPFK